MEYIKQIENIDKFREIKRKLRRKKDINSTEASEEIAQLFYNLIQDSIKNKGIKTHSELILLVKYLGKILSTVDPVQFCIGNTIKKILHIIREEISESTKEKNNTQNNSELLGNKIKEAKKNLKELKNFEFFKDIDSLDLERAESENSSEKNSSERLYEMKKLGSDAPITEENINSILEEISNLISEINSISETITKQKEIKDLISDGDIILTSNYSEQVVKILAENKKTKKFKVFVCESAPKLREKSQVEELKKIKVDLTVIEDDDIYSVMKKYTKVKVLLGAKAILVNGGLITYGGAYNICLLAKMFSNPVIIVGGTTKLTPMYSFKHELYNEYLSPDLIFGKNMDYKGDISNIQFNIPSLDYVPPNLISMYATDIGILNPNYLYKNFNDMYDLEDYEI
jgi:translation initiation factor eIF-2B subunit beta